MTNYLDWWAGQSDRIYHEKRVAVDCKSLGEGEWVDDMMMCDFARILQHQQDLLDKRVVIVEPLQVHTVMMCNGNKKAHDLYPFDFSSADYWAFHINHMSIHWLGTRFDVSKKIIFVVNLQRQHWQKGMSELTETCRTC